MGQLSILTTEQNRIISCIKTDAYFAKRFYFTGGTALSEFYLHHRHSDDLDFFSSEPIEQEIIYGLIQNWSKKLKFTFSARFVEVVYIFQLTFVNGVKLKVDFGHYAKQVEKNTIVEGLQIDSLRDIATNKLLTISQRTDVKDFVDLYYLSQEHFSLWDLTYSMEKKFHTETDPLLLASDFLKVEEFTKLPRMIKPLTLEQLQLYFRNLAKQTGKTAVEE